MSEDRPQNRLAALKAKLASQRASKAPEDEKAGSSAADRVRAKMAERTRQREAEAKAGEPVPMDEQGSTASKASAEPVPPPNMPRSKHSLANRTAGLPRKSPATDEPSNKLKELLLLRVEQSLAAQHSEIERLARATSALKANTDLVAWIEHYAEAITLAGNLKNDLDGKLAELGSLDARELKAATESLYEGPRRQFDQLRTGLLAENKAIVSEWENRSKRLFAELSDRARLRCDGVEVEDVNAGAAVQLSISDSWLEQFRRDVHDGGLLSLAGELPRCLEEDFGRLRLLCDRHSLTGDLQFSPPVVPPLELDDGSWVGRARLSEKKKVRGLFESVMREIRTQLMSLKYLFGMLVSVPLAFGAIMGSEAGASGAFKGAAVNTGAVLGLVTPLLIAYAIWSGRRDKTDQREEIIEVFSAKAKTEVDRVAQTAIKASEGRTIQWLEARRLDTERKVDDWFSRSIDPRLARMKRDAETKESELESTLNRKKDEADTLRTLGRKLAALGTELSKRRLELEDALIKARTSMEQTK